ncbi:hypothetical protein J4476_03870 [Candidatus Woesearchaeota archaeon]|nr:hypothetical protein [Candidatus Woesearchaeota archaeon]HIH26345.1 hypothetical protein [Nanoarchaeota archaeon]
MDKALLKKMSALSKYLGLKFNVKWCNYIFISKSMNVLLQYTNMCPDNELNKYGQDINTRLEKINKFLASVTFTKHSKRYGGQVYFKKNYKNDLRFLKNIENFLIKKEFSRLLKKIKQISKKSDRIILLTKTDNKYELKMIKQDILEHELIHVVLIKNNIYFQNKDSKYWKYDEGLVTYCDYLLNKKLWLLENIIKKHKKNSMEIDYFIYAVKFKELLKECKTPKDRRKELNILFNSLK